MKTWNRMPLLTVALLATFAAVGCESMEQLGGKKNESLSNADNRFFRQAAVGDLTEIRTSRLALQKSESQRVRQFAQMMIDDHQKVSRGLQRLAGRKDVDLPKELDNAHQTLVDNLAGTSTGRDFDRAYMRGQITAHQETISNYEDASEKAKDSDVRSFAKEQLPTLREHLRMAQNIADRL